jgi:hypothetical protein
MIERSNRIESTPPAGPRPASVRAPRGMHAGKGPRFFLASRREPKAGSHNGVGHCMLPQRAAPPEECGYDAAAMTK